MGELIHQHGVGMACQDGVQVHFFEVDAAVGNHTFGHDLQVADAVLGFLASVGFHQPDDYIHTLLMLHPVGVVEHVIGLAHAGRGAYVDAELGGFLLTFQFDLCHMAPNLPRRDVEFLLPPPREE